MSEPNQQIQYAVVQKLLLKQIAVQNVCVLLSSIFRQARTCNISFSCSLCWCSVMSYASALRCIANQLPTSNIRFCPLKQCKLADSLVKCMQGQKSVARSMDGQTLITLQSYFSVLASNFNGQLHEQHIPLL